MRSSVIGLVAILALSASASVHTQSSQFQFFVSLADAAGTPLAKLEATELQVLEDGVAGKVLKVDPIDWPVKVAILIDNGPGSSERTTHVRNGLKGLIEALPDGVEAGLQTTAPQPRWIVRPTTDHQALITGVDRITPDSGAGRFVEGLIETVTRFDKERGNYFPVVVIMGSLAAEGSSIRERDVDRMFRQVAERAVTVHVVMLSTGAQSQSGGANQTQLGLAVTKQTGGRYESIAASTRLATLLPEIGTQVAQSHARQSKQFRVTFERPNGKTGAIGAVSLGARGAQNVKLSIDGRLP